MEGRLKWIEKKKRNTKRINVLRGEGGVGGACENFVCSSYTSITIIIIVVVISIYVYIIIYYDVGAWA